MHGAGLNRADLAQRAGHYPSPPGWPADIPGLEFAGEVVGLGPNVDTFSVGDRVFGLVGGGGQAEMLTVPAAHCVHVPEGVDLVAAGGIPEAFITAHDAMVTQATVGRGEVVLVHAAGSGVGTAAVQLAHANGCTVVGTSRTPEKLEQCRRFGLDHAVVAPRELDPAALADEIVAAAGAVDVTIDLVGGNYLVTDVRAAARLGRIVMVASQAGARADLEIGAVMGKRLRIHGTVLRGRSVDEKTAATDAFARDVVPLLASGDDRAGRRADVPARRRGGGVRPARVQHGLRQDRARPDLTIRSLAAPGYPAPASAPNARRALRFTRCRR